MRSLFVADPVNWTAPASSGPGFLGLLKKSKFGASLKFAPLVPALLLAEDDEAMA